MQVRAFSRAIGAVLVVLLAGCGAADGGASDGVAVVTTTEILADLVRNVGGERVRVDSLVPPGGDPHSYEPVPADAKKVAKADVTFTNHLLLEEQRLIKAIDANIRPGTPNASLAEASETYGAHVIPLVENIGLDVLWLGLRVRGDGKEKGATRTSDIRLTATAVEGPGALVAYLTETLGKPVVYFNSQDGLSDTDATTLPPAAHTHINWAFTKPGVYKLTLAASLIRGEGVAPTPLGTSTFTFAVGVNPAGVAKTVLADGHTDLTIDLDSGELYTLNDIPGGGKQNVVAAADAVIEVPNKAIVTVPDDPRFSFLGQAGGTVHQLPQAVLGKHVHGEIDPHLWQNVRNARAYVELIRDTIRGADPSGAEIYDRNARAYLDRLDELDAHVRETVARIPRERRQLITTHDGFGYFAAAYEMTVAGFVVPNPAQEPSVEDVRKLSETVRNLKVPAVFMEPNLAQRASVLNQVAKDQSVDVCVLYGDSFDDRVQSYVDMMRHNADEVHRCLV
ncbi:anchored repeat ABC transporter substrate-binding protein [Lentzea atacamensis]|uniref:Anchored repeat ABC transporter substrate-binding protein n=1 Tax=Lentzea atacamensis TaxID=531938 RepID=A0ABX9EDU1_9PSEU|nr:anchored repeat ABC transporter, substrate-binding protein [Lentzea atacamensis]RAS67349.1 anchored repeat ABC transporter substrate-binding protein [Lentzea atacamensis]